MRETWVRSLVGKDPLEKEMATHSSTLAWKIPWTEESMGSQRVGHDWATSLSPLIAMCPWISYLPSYSLNFFIYKRGTKLVPHRVSVRKKNEVMHIEGLRHNKSEQRVLIFATQKYYSLFVIIIPSVDNISPFFLHELETYQSCVTINSDKPVQRKI